jgi:hypothetical protein
VDRAVDNGSDPDENDGKLYEISFPPGEVSRSFSVSITDDMFDEAEETVNLAMTNPANATLGGQDSATLTIVDDDPPPSVNSYIASFSVD